MRKLDPIGFEMPIRQKRGYDVKDFDLPAGDEGPTGRLHSIGTFTAQNMKMMESPYRRFTFPLSRQSS